MNNLSNVGNNSKADIYFFDNQAFLDLLLLEVATLEPNKASTGSRGVSDQE